MPGMKVHHVEVDTSSEWDGAAEVAKLETPISGEVARGMFAWYDAQGSDDNNDGWPDGKVSYKFPHHNVVGSEPREANLRAVNNALARLSQADIPENSVADVRAHLQTHQEDAKNESKRKTMSKNPIIRLLQSITDVVNTYVIKERSMNAGAVWQAVQKSLDESADGGGYVVDVYPETGFALTTKGDGKLYKTPVTVDGDGQLTIGAQEEVVMTFTPVTRQLSIKRQADGSVRWFAMPACTAVLNRSGEIDSRALFDSFVDYVERTKDYPELDFFHLGESLVLGKADWVARDGFAYCASGTFYDTPVARAAIKSLEEDPAYWGLSIAYLPTGEPETLRSSEGIEIPVFNVGINRFISLLPEDTAASILTSISTEGVNRMNKKIEDALKKLTGDDAELFKELAEKVDGVNRSAEGMINREKPTPVPAVETPAVKIRELTEDDIKMILDSAQFKDRVTAIVQELYPDAQRKVEEDKPAETPQPEAQRTTADNEVLDAIKKLKDVVDGLVQERAAQTAVENDMPARMAATKIIRPRATRMPDSIGSHVKPNVSLAEIAGATLATMGEEA